MPSSCIDCIFIYTLWAFEARTWENITGFAISWALTQLSFTEEKLVKQAEQAFKVAMQPSERKNHNKSFCAMSQLLNKTNTLSNV